MDKEAVNSSLDDVLSELCLLATGGLLALRAFYLKIEIANETSEKKWKPTKRTQICNLK